MKCLVIGGSGFIGSNLVEALVEAGHAVTIFDRPGTQLLCPSIIARNQAWIEGNFLDPQAVDSAVVNHELVFHLVSTTLPSDSNGRPVFDVQSNLVASVELMQSCVSHKIQRLFFLSSGGTVYGNPVAVPLREDHPTDPTCSYGIVKLAIEKYLALFYQLHKLPYSVVRLANPYGPYQRLGAVQGVIGVFVEKALKGEKLTIWGNGELVRDYIFIKDAVDAIVALASIPDAVGTFNLGSGEGATINQIVGALRSVIGHEVETEYLPSRGFDVEKNYLDISKIVAKTGWIPQTPLSQGIKATVDYYRAKLSSTGKHSGD